MLAFVLNTFGEAQPSEVLFDAVHATQPMQRVSNRALGTELPMDCVEFPKHAEICNDTTGELHYTMDRTASSPKAQPSGKTS